MQTKLKAISPKRSKLFRDIINRFIFVQGFDYAGASIEKWIVIGKDKVPEEESMQEKKLNNTIQPREKKLNNTITLKLPQIGDLVTHSVHPLGLGLVVEKHHRHKAYRVQWVDQPKLILFIAENMLIPINKEHAHESDDL